MKIRNITEVCSEIFAGGDAPRESFSPVATNEFSIPIYSNGEENEGLYGYTNHARVTRPSVTVSARGTIGYTAIREKPFVPIVRLITLVPRTEIIGLKYLYYALQNYPFNGSGTSIPQLTVPMIKQYAFPVPILDEQRKITAALDKVSDLIAMRKKQLQKLDDLVKSQFVEMFGDLETNPKGYEQRKLGSLANKISDGVHAKPVYTETGRPFISVVNINKGVIDFEECKFVSEDAYQKMIKSTHPERGDILYTKVGATYGIPAYVDTDTEFCLYVSVCLIKPKHDEIDARFLALSMSTPYIKRQADSRIKGIGVPDLHLNQIREFDVICPPRHEQEAFVTFVEQINKSKLTIQQSLDKLELTKKALMQKYFG